MKDFIENYCNEDFEEYLKLFTLKLKEELGFYLDPKGFPSDLKMKRDYLHDASEYVDKTIMLQCGVAVGGYIIIPTVWPLFFLGIIKDTLADIPAEDPLLFSLLGCIISLGVLGLGALALGNAQKELNQLYQHFIEDNNSSLRELMFFLCILYVEEKFKHDRKSEADWNKVPLLLQQEFETIGKNLVKQIRGREFSHKLSDALTPYFMSRVNPPSVEDSLNNKMIAFKYLLDALEHAMDKSNPSIDKQRFIKTALRIRHETERDLIAIHKLKEKENSTCSTAESTNVFGFFSLQKDQDNKSIAEEQFNYKAS